MKLLALSILSSLLTLIQVSLVVGDVGTAAAYGPPYIREWAIRQFFTNCKNQLSLSYLLVLLCKLCAATACGGDSRDQFPPGNLFVSVSEGLWDNGAACGRRYRIRCVSGKNRPCKRSSVDVKVVDFCATSPCPDTLLMSNDAFAAISRFPKAKINIEYTQ